MHFSPPTWSVPRCMDALFNVQSASVNRVLVDRMGQ